MKNQSSDWVLKPVLNPVLKTYKKRTILFIGIAYVTQPNNKKAIDNQRLFLLSSRYFSQIPDVTLAFMAGYLLMLKTGCLTPDLI